MVRPPPTPAAPRRIWRCTMLAFSVAAGDNRRPSAVNDQVLPTVGACWQPVHAASRPSSLDPLPVSQVPMSWHRHGQKSAARVAAAISSPSSRPMTPGGVRHVFKCRQQLFGQPRCRSLRSVGNATRGETCGAPVLTAAHAARAFCRRASP